MTLHTVVLRYYDFNVETIKEHVEIIQKANVGYVWWGWWKKSQEQGQLAALEELSTKCPINIGLVNRTSGEFYSARCEKVVFELGGAHFATPEIELTPSYYNTSTHPAWFKLSSFQSLSEKEYLEQFAAIPKGEPTLFIVERRAAGLTLIDEGVEDQELIRTRGNSILHLSDIHFGDDHGYPPIPSSSPLSVHPLVEAITGAIREAALGTPGVVVVSGDFLTKGNPEGYIVAQNFLVAILERLGLGKEHLVVVPGNHDISISDYQTAPYRYEPEDPYRNFLKSFYGTSDSKIERLQHFITPTGWTMNVLSLNSSSIRKKDYMEYGYVGKDKYTPFLEIINERNNGRSAAELIKDKVLNFVVLHHHLLPVQDIDVPEPARPVSIMLDAGQLVSNFQNANIHYVLHGHQHLPFIGSTARARRDKNTWRACDYPLFVLGSGSSGAIITRLPPRLPFNTLSMYTPTEDAFNVRIEQFNQAVTSNTYLNLDIPKL